MAATYIPVSIEDFERVFGVIPHKKTGKRAFELVSPARTEAYYLCILRETKAGTLYLKVWTSIAAGETDARNVGEDAIRCVLHWIDAEGWEKALGKGRRVYRSGGQGKTAADIIERALERAREVAKCRGKLPECPDCGRPMGVRTAKKTGRIFYGCIGWKPNGGCNGVKWETDPNDPAVKEAAEKWERKAG